MLNIVHTVIHRSKLPAPARTARIPVVYSRCRGDLPRTPPVILPVQDIARARKSIPCAVDDLVEALG
jgi:hypothetical protein